MHIVSNIRNLEKFLKFFPRAANDALSEDEHVQRYNAKNLRAHQYDLIIAKATAIGATLTEDRDGNEREIGLGEWLIAPLIGRESTLGHSSVLPRKGIAVGMVIDYISTGGGLGVSMDNPNHADNGDPTKVTVMGILCYEDGRIARSLDFALDTKAPSTTILCPMIGVVGSRSGADKTAACLEVIKNLHESGRKVGVTKLSGTAQRKEILELAVHAEQYLDTADAGLPTTYPPSQDIDDRMDFAAQQTILAAKRIVLELSVSNQIIVAEFGGDLLSANVPELLSNPSQLNIVALVLVVESATAAIGMETKLYKFSNRYKTLPKYVVGPTANLKANRNRVRREIDCVGCYDLWSKQSKSASREQVDNSIAQTEILTRELLENCNFWKRQKLS
ncbi:MAG: hypothetical protein Q9167_004568 [Letrouitia subvulpina]